MLSEDAHSRTPRERRDGYRTAQRARRATTADVITSWSFDRHSRCISAAASSMRPPYENMMNLIGFPSELLSLIWLRPKRQSVACLLFISYIV